MLVDTSLDFQPSPDGVVRWVASQSPNPALQALMKEAEREKKTRPSMPVHEPMSWMYPLASSTSSSSSLSTGHNSADTSYLLPLSGNSSSASSSAPPASEPSLSRRAKPLSAMHRKPLSSTNQPLRDSARPRSSSHSTIQSNPSMSTQKYIPQEEEPEAMAFIELLKDVSRQLDQNSEKKQRLVAREKEKEREGSPGRNSIDNRTGSGTYKSSACPLTKTTSTFAICPQGSSTRPLERISNTPLSALRPEHRGRLLTKTTSLDGAGIDVVSGKSTPASLPSTNLNYDSKLTPANVPNTHPTTARKNNAPRSSLDDGDGTMQGVIDLTETDMEWERPISISGPISRTNTATSMRVDDDDDDMYNDTAMNMSFFLQESLPQTRVAAPKPKLQPPHPSTASRRAAPTQHTRTGPPPLGMRRAPQLQASQYCSSQSSKGVTVPRFKPPLLADAARTTNKSGNGTYPTTTGSKLPPRSETTKVPVTGTATGAGQDADSSFDVSFDMDVDTLEEAMRAYD